MRVGRRSFIGMMGATALCGGASPLPDRPKFHVFSRSFQHHDWNSFSELCAKAGLDGIEWTVRQKGHVAPERAKTDLSRAVAAAKSQGLESSMIVTEVKGDGSQAEETLLKAAGDCGVKMFRPSHFFYDRKASIRDNIDTFRRGFENLAKLAEKSGVRCGYQNHSSWNDTVFGGLVCDIYEFEKSLDPKFMGLQFDLMHAYFETTLSWTHAFEVSAGYVSSEALKDFFYVMKPDGKSVRKQLCPAGQGVTPWKQLAQLNRKCGVSVPYSLHFEFYTKSDPDNELKMMKDELGYFKSVLS